MPEVMANGMSAARNCPAKIFRKSSGALTAETMREAAGNEKAQNVFRARQLAALRDGAANKVGQCVSPVRPKGRKGEKGSGCAACEGGDAGEFAQDKKTFQDSSMNLKTQFNHG